MFFFFADLITCVLFIVAPSVNVSSQEIKNRSAEGLWVTIPDIRTALKQKFTITELSTWHLGSGSLYARTAATFTHKTVSFQDKEEE